MSYQELVQNYIDKYDTSPLKFAKPTYHSHNFHYDEKADLKELVIDILKGTLRLFSVVAETEEYECDADRNRSSLDIWRHVIFFRPSTTIFEVMEKLYELVAERRITSIYCGNVKRRVFRYYTDSNHLGCSTNDEYGLELINWKRIAHVETT